MVTQNLQAADYFKVKAFLILLYSKRKMCEWIPRGNLSSMFSYTMDIFIFKYVFECKLPTMLSLFFFFWNKSEQALVFPAPCHVISFMSFSFPTSSPERLLPLKLFPHSKMWSYSGLWIKNFVLTHSPFTKTQMFITAISYIIWGIACSCFPPNLSLKKILVKMLTVGTANAVIGAARVCTVHWRQLFSTPTKMGIMDERLFVSSILQEQLLISLIYLCT